MANNNIQYFRVVASEIVFRKSVYQSSRW